MLFCWASRAYIISTDCTIIILQVGQPDSDYSKPKCNIHGDPSSQPSDLLHYEEIDRPLVEISLL